MVLNIRHSVQGGTAGGPGLSAPPAGAGVTGLSRTTYSGSSTISTNGTTISRKNINSQMTVTADNVTFSDCMFDVSGDNWGIDADSMDGLTVDHCTFVAIGGTSGNAFVLTGNNWEVTNCDMSGNFDNGFQVQGGTGICTGNYIHDLHPGSVGEAHIDGIQLAGAAGPGVLISGNWVESWDTSCIIIKADFGDIDGVTVTGNTLINTPGKQTAYCIYTVPVGSNSVSNITITNNRIQEGNGGYFSDDGATGLTWSGNVDYVSGDPVSA